MRFQARIPFAEVAFDEDAAVVHFTGDLRAIKSQPTPQCLRPSLPPGVLVVDAERAVLSVMEAALQRVGFQVWSADNGYEAVELYCMHWEVISVVLLDVQMPGVDGPRTLCALQKVRPTVCCCFMTGNPGHYSEADLLLLGAAYVFRKPFAMVEVIETLKQLAKGSSWSSGSE
jgi:DNA-binding NtrC family response regulator